MARARNIKPGFFQNESLGEIDPLARLFFIGLWTIADFKGCLEFRKKRIKVQLLPYDECDVGELAIILERSGFISSYSVQGQEYLKIHNFERHQNPHKNEREAGSEIPEMPVNARGNEESRLISINPEQNGTTRADSLLPLPDSLMPNVRELETDEETIFTASILSDVKSELGIKKLSLSDSRKWENEIHLAYENGFKAEDFVDCFRLLRQQEWRSSAVRPNHVTENLSNLAKLKREAAQQKGPSERLPTLEEKLADRGTVRFLPPTAKADKCMT